MAGYVIHIAVAQEYLKKHGMEYSEEFINGTIAPDLTDDKTKTHYGKSPAYTNLEKYLENNRVDSLYNQGFFLHLITDYLFYNYYLDKCDKETMHNDYDCTNKAIMEKYKVTLLEKIKPKVFFKEEEPKILTLDLVCKVIDEISSYNMKEIEKEVLEKNKKWSFYKNLV